MTFMVIQHRRGTAAQAAASNPVLAVGERGYETDTKRWKTGDGATPWNSLPYDGGSASIPDATTTGREVLTGTPEEARTALGAAPISVGRAAQDFGIGPERTAAQNATGFADAVEWATASNQSRTLVLPPIPVGQYINLEAPVEVGGGFRMQGAGDPSRFFMRTEPEPGFIANGPVNIQGISFQGPPSRTVTTGQYAFGLRRQYGHLNYVGVLCVKGSDGSVIRDIYGRNIAMTVAGWAWDPDTDAYAGSNIQGLTIQNIYSDTVWSGVFWREVDNISVRDVFTKGYKRQGPEAAESPPHGIYCTSTGADETKYYMRGGYVNNVQVFGGTDGSAVSFKYLIGAHISDISAKNCNGLLDTHSLEDTVIDNVVGIADACQLAIGTEHPGALNVYNCKRTLINRVRVNQTDQATARVLYMHGDNVDTEVRDFQAVANYPSALGSARTEVALLRSGTLTRPNIRNDGTLIVSHGIRRHETGGDVQVIDPTISGKIRRPLSDSAGTAAVSRWQYDEKKVNSDQSHGFPKMWAAEGTTFTKYGLGPAPAAGLLAWSDPLYDARNESSRITYLASGHALTSSSGLAVNESGAAPYTGWMRATSAAAGLLVAWADTGKNNVDVSMDLRVGSSPGTAHGILLNYVDASNYRAVELRSGGLYLVSVSAGVSTDIASYLFTRATSRVYNVRSRHYGGLVTVWLDGTERIAEISTGGPAFAAYGTSTKHGYLFRDASTGEHAGNLRVRATG